MSSSYHAQLEYAKSIAIREGERRRIDCIFCGGTKTFTLTKSPGQLQWNCFRAVCPAHGVADSERSLDSMKGIVAAGDYTRKQIKRDNTVEIPALLSRVEDQPKVIEFLHSVHSYDAWKAKRVKLAYDPADHRVLFFMNEGKGAVGRALDKRKPKWKAYGDCSGVFVCKGGPTAVVVEDAASACAVSSDFTGIALLGTNMSDLQHTRIKCVTKALKKVLLALDKDASMKAIKLMARLQQGTRNVGVRFLDRDLKWLDPHEVRKVLTYEDTSNCPR